MRVFSIVLFALVAVPSFAQKFSPENLGPDMPTPQIIVEKMLEAGRVKPGETVYDLGSGDGRVLITAVQKFGAKGVGIEIMPELCDRAREHIKVLGLEDKISIVEGSALRVNLSPADVVTMCFLTSSNERLRPALEKYLKPTARVVSSQFPIKNWKAAQIVHVKVGTMEHSIYVYEMGNR